jgi:hypothetical protein
VIAASPAVDRLSTPAWRPAVATILGDSEGADPRICTFLRDAGTGYYPSLRRTLSLLTAQIAAVYQSFHRLGLRGADSDRRGWCRRDADMDWLLTLAGLFLTARRLIYDNGYYDRAAAEVNGADLRRYTIRKKSQLGPPSDLFKQIEKERAAWLPVPAEPESVTDFYGGLIRPPGC